MWTKRSDPAPEHGCANFFFNMCSKRTILGILFMFDLLPFFPSFLVTMKMFGKTYKNKKHK